MNTRTLLVIAACLAAAASSPALPAGFAQRELITGLDAVSAAALPDGRVLAIEKFGRIHLIKDGVKQAQPLLDWEANTQSAYEKGMMTALADPDFAENGYLYVQYCNKREGVNGRDQVSRFTVVGDTVDRNSEKLILGLGDAGPNYHHGGGLAIAGDKLFIASGNRGSVGDGAPGPANSGNKNTVQGKILRVNIPEGDIPSDNPFYAENTGDGRAVYYWGLRNPFTMSWNPETNKLWFSEVRSTAADDRVFEGGAPGTDYGFTGRTAVTPLWTSQSSGTGGRAMIGSHWYTGSNFPAEWKGRYFFGGIDVNQVRWMPGDRSTGASNFSAFTCPIDVKQDAAGALLVTTRCQTENVRYTTGKVTRVWYGAQEPPSALRASPSDAAARRVKWSAAPGGLRVEALASGSQRVELRALDGRLLASRALSARGETAVLETRARGAHLLVWRGEVRRAAATVILP